MKKYTRNIRYFIEYTAFYLAYLFFRYIPFSSLCIQPLGLLGYKLNIRKDIVIRNLGRAFGKEFRDEKLVKKIYINAAHVLIDLFLIDKKLDYTIENFRVIGELKNKNTPVVCVSCHLGNWEIMPRIFIQNGVPGTVIAKPIHNPFVNRFIAKKRLSAGVNIVYTQKRGLVRLITALKNNHTIGFLMDQNAGKRGIPIPFFGTSASTFTGPAVICLKWKLPLFFAYSVRNRDGSYRIILDDLILPEQYIDSQQSREKNMENLLIMINQKIEQAVKKHPEQWFWFHRRWQ